jgi:hypothetical protein
MPPADPYADFRAWCNIYAPGNPQAVRGLAALAELDRLRMELTGHEKAADLMNKGMESLAELMDGLKQEVRDFRSKLEPVRALVARNDEIHDDAFILVVTSPKLARVDGEPVVTLGDLRRLAETLP